MYEALLIVSFGGPERAEDVLPFLENVSRGRKISRERLLEVAEHYYRFGGKSPINDQCRQLIGALRKEIPAMPIYWGNRNWYPFLSEALSQMRQDGVKRALAFVMSPYSSYSSCRQYRENIAAAQAEAGEGAPQVDKLRAFYNHPGFIAACVDRVREAQGSVNTNARLIFSAHSIPLSMAGSSDYERQLREASRLVAESLGYSEWDLAFQSRSGPPTQSWLEPDILDHLRHLRRNGSQEVIVAPIGFISDHMEVVYDLDLEAADLAKELGMNLVRAGTVGTHPAFIRMIRELVEERTENARRLAIGLFGPSHDVCPSDCCPPPSRPGKSPASEAQTALQRF